jgi:hypothetical protein
MQLTSTDHLELDTFWATKPAPRTPIRPDQYFGAVTVTITCRVCSKREPQTLGSPALLCRTCKADLPKAEATIQERMEAIKAAHDQEMDRWAELQSGLDDATADRWTRLTQDQQRVEAQLQRAQTGTYHGYSQEQIAANIAAKQAAFDEVLGRITRTLIKGGPIADLLKARHAHEAAIQKLNEQRRNAEMALSEIDSEGVPF